MKLFFVGFAVVAFAACSNNPVEPASIFDPPTLRWARLAKSCPADAPATSLPAELKATLPQPGPFKDIDERAAEISRQVPGGWGGYAYIENSHYNMFLVDLSQREAAIAALSALGVPLDPYLEMHQGRWDFGQLYDWYRYLGPRALSGIKWSASDIQEARNRIEYSVIDEAERTKLEQALSDLDIPCNLVAISIMGYPTLMTR
jgi:hypothetical protein